MKKCAGQVVLQLMKRAWEKYAQQKPHNKPLSRLGKLTQKRELIYFDKKDGGRYVRLPLNLSVFRNISFWILNLYIYPLGTM